MEKYNLIHDQLLYEGTMRPENFFEPPPINEKDLLRAHDAAYWTHLREGTLSAKEMRRTGFPWSEALIHRERVIMNGTCMAANFARTNGIGMNISGGTHHASRTRGEGFCLLNDIAIAALQLLESGRAKKILIVDLDVHQGDGTANILQSEDRAFTFSMHCEANFPLIKEKSDLDVALPLGMTDEPYLDLVRNHLPELMNRVKPDFAFYLSGVDVLATDKLGKLALTREGCKTRDRMVIEAFHFAGIPLCISMGGGYSENIKDIVEAHCNTFRLAQAIGF
jgi:acetoin utilization deacetylase AcuC-like enzyme